MQRTVDLFITIKWLIEIVEEDREEMKKGSYIMRSFELQAGSMEGRAATHCNRQENPVEDICTFNFERSARLLTFLAFLSVCPDVSHGRFVHKVGCFHKEKRNPNSSSPISVLSWSLLNFSFDICDKHIFGMKKAIHQRPKYV